MASRQQLESSTVGHERPITPFPTLFNTPVTDDNDNDDDDDDDDDDSGNNTEVEVDRRDQSPLLEEEEEDEEKKEEEGEEVTTPPRPSSLRPRGRESRIRRRLFERGSNSSTTLATAITTALMTLTTTAAAAATTTVPTIQDILSAARRPPQPIGSGKRRASFLAATTTATTAAAATTTTTSSFFKPLFNPPITTPAVELQRPLPFNPTNLFNPSIWATATTTAAAAATTATSPSSTSPSTTTTPPTGGICLGGMMVPLKIMTAPDPANLPEAELTCGRVGPGARFVVVQEGESLRVVYLRCKHCRTIEENRIVDNQRQIILDKIPARQPLPRDYGIPENIFFSDDVGNGPQRRLAEEQFENAKYGVPYWRLLLGSLELFQMCCTHLQQHLISYHYEDYRKHFVYRYSLEVEKRDQQWRQMVDLHHARRLEQHENCQRCHDTPLLSRPHCNEKKCGCFCHDPPPGSLRLDQCCPIFRM